MHDNLSHPLCHNISRPRYRIRKLGSSQWLALKIEKISYLNMSLKINSSVKLIVHGLNTYIFEDWLVYLKKNAIER